MLEIAGVEVESLPPNILDKFVLYLQDLDYKPRSIQTMLSGVREYLKYVERNSEGKISLKNIYNPKTPRIKPSYKNILSAEQMRQALSTADTTMSSSKSAYISVLACSGLRANEARLLLVENLSRAENGTIMIRVRSETEDGENAAKFGKERMVPMLSFGVDSLLSHLSSRRNQFSPYIFSSPRKTNGPISHRSVFLWLEELSENFGMKIEPHTFRRSYLTLLHNSGVPDITVQKIAGHSTLAQTSEYIKMDADALSKSVLDVKL